MNVFFIFYIVFLVVLVVFYCAVKTLL